jgi:hypothetical protein
MTWSSVGLNKGGLSLPTFFEDTTANGAPEAFNVISFGFSSLFRRYSQIVASSTGIEEQSIAFGTP